MEYQALYRAFRPQKFSDVVGQHHVTKTLQNAIIRNKESHAYLFSGPRGTGKTSIDKVFAKALNVSMNKTVSRATNANYVSLLLTAVRMMSLKSMLRVITV